MTQKLDGHEFEPMAKCIVCGISWEKYEDDPQRCTGTPKEEVRAKFGRGGFKRKFPSSRQ